MDATNGSIMVQNYQDATKLSFDRHIYQPVSAGQSGNQWEDYRSIESSRVNTTMVVQKFSHTYEQESTLPIFMRNLAKLNGVYPNFSHSGRPTA